MLVSKDYFLFGDRGNPNKKNVVLMMPMRGWSRRDSVICVIMFTLQPTRGVMCPMCRS